MVLPPRSTRLLTLAGSVLIVATLTGCSSPNDAVCRDLTALASEVDAAYGDLASRDEWVTPESADEWQGVGDRVDRLAVRADGLVQERILAISENWPRLDQLVHGTAGPDFQDRWVKAARACNA